MGIGTVSSIRHMTYDFYFRPPMQMVKLKIDMIIVENVHLIETLDRSINHPLLRKNSYKKIEEKPIFNLKRFCFMMINAVFSIYSLNILTFLSAFSLYVFPCIAGVKYRL